MPLGLDPFQQIVNVKWAGGGFVVKSREAFLYCGSGKTSDKWQSLGQPHDIFGFANSGSSYAEIGKTETKPGTQVFVISALRRSGDANNNVGGVILASSNGSDWDLVFENYEVTEGAHRDPFTFKPTGIVWDEDTKKFYAAFYTVIADFDDIGRIITTDGERIYSSPNGRNWTLLIDDVSHPLPPGIDSHSESLLMPFCKKPENTMGDNKMPDGVQAYDKVAKTFMKPTSLTFFSPTSSAVYDGMESSVKIITETEEGKTTTTKSTSAPCYAVAQIGGSWAACGGADRNLSIDISTDNGETWTQAYTDKSGNSLPAVTVSAGQKVAGQ
jgi:hypothetical protein